jgi:integrase/recombinase XerD
VRHTAAGVWGIAAGTRAGESFCAVRLELARGRLAYWTVFDLELRRVPVVDDFLFAVVRSGRAENTCRAYALDIVGFLRWAHARKRAWMDVHVLEDFQAFLLVDRSRLGGVRATSSINRLLTAVRALLRFCIEAGHLPSRDFGALYGTGDYRFLPSEARGEREVSMDRPVARHRVADQLNEPSPMVITQDEYVAMLAAANTSRDRLLLAVMHDCGLRIGEALGLWRGDLHLSEGETSGCPVSGPHVHVKRRRNANGAMGKSKKSRWVPASPEVVGWYGLYLRERDRIAGARRRRLLFVNMARHVGAPMSYPNAYDVVCAIGRRAGVNVRVTPHTLRHCYGTGLRSGGAERDVIAALMGHRSHSSADVYIHASDDELRSAVQGMVAVRALTGTR